MSIQLVTGFLVNAAESLDNRIVASGSTERDAIPYKYEGMRVFDLSNERSYFWTNGSFQPEITDQVNGTASYVPKFTSQYYIGNSYIYDAGSKIGIGTNAPTGDYTYLQIGGMSLSEDPQYYAQQGMPLVIHKGGNTVVGHNWYYSGLVNNAFDLNLGSTWLTFEKEGTLIFKTRKAGVPFTSSLTTIYISDTGRVGIGPNWSTPTIQPAEVLDVTGNVKVSNSIYVTNTLFSSYIKVSNTTAGQNWGLILDDNTALASPIIAPPAGQGLFIDWSINTPPGGKDYIAGISAFSRIGTLGSPDGGDLIFYTRSGSTAVLNPADNTRPRRMIIKNTGEVSIGEDPSGAYANGPTTIVNAISNLFGNIKPKFEVYTGTITGAYTDLMVLRHPANDSSAVLRRMGYILKLSNESSTTESNKSGGIIIESNSANATNPSLHLILGQSRYLNIDNEGSVWLPSAGTFNSNTIWTISPSSPLFPSVKPKFEVNTGSSNGAYNELMVLRHLGNDNTDVTRRLGYVMALSSENNLGETNKSGGVILESTLGFASSPKLHLVIENQKKLSIDSTNGVMTDSITYGTENNKVITGAFTFGFSNTGINTTFNVILGQIPILGNSFIWVEATFVNKIYNTLMFPTLLSRTNTIREYYRVDSGGNLILISGDDPITNTPIPITTSFGTITMFQDPGFGFIDTSTPSFLVFKNSGAILGGFNVSMQVYYRVHINWAI